MTTDALNEVPGADKPAASPAGFYDEALPKAERLRRARTAEGLDEEIALLRVRLADLLREDPGDPEALFKGIEVLVKAVAARHRLSKRAEKDLCDSVANVIHGIGDALWPEGFHGPA